MAIDAQFLETLRNRLAISDVVGKRVRLIHAGREKKACCPFHKEKTPSFTVNDHKGFFHCFGCGAHGDIIGFVMRAENRDFIETVELLAAEAGLSVPRSDPAERARAQHNRDLYQLVEAATGWFETQLFEPHGQAALIYLTERGLSQNAITRFRLGYAPADGRALARYLNQAGFSEADMVEVGLLKRPDDGRAPYGFFRHRAIFPVNDRRGRIVGFGARKLEGDGPKYINSAETPLFHKGQLLYGLSRAREAVGTGAPLIVAEGYMDVITLAEAGFPGALAPLGTALGEEQLLTLWRLFPNGEGSPILCFDGDAAGRRAAWRAIERTLPHLAPGRSVRLAFLPEGEDPDSLIRHHGAGAMKAVLDASLPLDQAVWEMHLASRSANTPEEKAALRRDLEETARRIAHRDVQGFYRRDLMRRFDEHFSARRSYRGPRHEAGGGVSRTARSTGHGHPDPAWADRYAPFRAEARRRARIRPDVRGLRERILLAALINHPTLLDEFSDTLLTLPMSKPELEALRAGLLLHAGDVIGPDESRTAAGADDNGLSARLRQDGHDQALNQVLCPHVYAHAGFARPDSDPDTCRQALTDLITLSEQAGLRQDLSQATEQAKSNLTEHNLLRVTLLREEMLTKIGGMDEPS